MAILRGILLAVLATLLLIALTTTPVYAQRWNSAITSGLTSVYSIFENGAYTWTLQNNTSLARDTEPAFDILVWELVPYQVRQPLSWAAPEGWEWSGDRWKLVQPNRKYYTPHALGPGAAIVFRYAPDPKGALVNSRGPQPEGLGFVAHVAAVVPGSGSANGSVKWIPVDTPYGQTWYDRPTVNRLDLEPVPEPNSFFLIAAMCGLGLACARRKQHGRPADRLLGFGR